MRNPFRYLIVGALVMVGALLPASAASANYGGHRHATPVIFVHGMSGSAQQFETNAMRFTSNGYPDKRLYAYEYNTLVPSNVAAVAGLDGFIADVKAKTGASRVDILAHSRGTTVMHEFLSTPTRAANVRRYVNFDGRTSASEPGGVPTLAVWGEGDQTRAIGGATNVYFPDKAHTEVTTSAEAFAHVYKFLTGKRPKTTRVVPQHFWQVKVSGRVVTFPDNLGNAGARLEIYRVDRDNGARISATPVHAVTLGADGSFGPFRLLPRRHYEFAVVKAGDRTIHFYPEPYERSDHFVRVLSAPLLLQFIDNGPNQTGMAVTRMREWWGDQASAGDNDRLEIDGLNVLNPAIAPRARRVIAVFAFDRNSDGVTDTSASLPPFSVLTFLTGVDVYMPASSDASGTISVTETVRGSGGHTETINVPNWPSDQHQSRSTSRTTSGRRDPGGGGRDGSWWLDDLVALREEQGHVVLGLTVLAHGDLAAGALVGA